MWLVFTLLAALFWGIGQVIIKKGFSHVPPLFNNILAAIIIPILAIPFALAHGVNFSQIPHILPLTIVVGIIFLLYYYVISLGKVALTGTVIGISPVFTVILSIIFLHESPTLLQILAIVIILIGTVFIALPDKLNQIRKIKLGTWFWLALFNAVIIGFGDLFIKTLLNQSDVYTYLFTYSFVLIVVTFISILFDKKGRQLPKFTLKKYMPTLVGVMLMELGFISFHIAASKGLMSLVSPISSIYIAITAILAWLFLKEKISKVHFVGIAITAIGVVLIGFA